MKTLKLVLILILILLSNELLFSHTEYFKRVAWQDPNTFVIYHFLQQNTPLNQALKWYNNDYGNLEVNEVFNYETIPTYLNLLDVELFFDDGLNDWEFASWDITFYQDRSGGVDVFFSNDPKYFTDPINTQGVATQLK